MFRLFLYLLTLRVLQSIRTLQTRDWNLWNSDSWNWGNATLQWIRIHKFTIYVAWFVTTHYLATSCEWGSAIE